MVKYNQSVIYKIYCNNPEIKDIYIGSTTSLKHRRYEHKYNCITTNRQIYNLKVYQYIREHGGWSNWKIVQIERYVAVDRQDLCKREMYWIETLDPKLNTRSSMKSFREREQAYKEKFDCECGGRYTCRHKSEHFKTIKHQRYLTRDKSY